jgi:succinate dehydrogenase/fumarate reductase flavoprotein subunit
MVPQLRFLGKTVKVIDRVYDCLVAGTGAAGYNAAIHLVDFGVENIAVLSEDRLNGTSRNTGSDKQTYYKVSCAGAEGDSPRSMAETLFSGGAMDGDIALCEAAHSLEEFFHLVSLGVPFPHNSYGEFPGYQTDHDSRRRASSTGPYTSRAMTEALEKEAFRKGIAVIDKTRVIKILCAGEGTGGPDGNGDSDGNSGSGGNDGSGGKYGDKGDKEGNGGGTGGGRRAFGLLCLEEENVFSLYLAKNIIFAGGGNPGLYRRTVYPPGQFGSSGVLAREGVRFANITEWQYGIGSVKSRWNFSGSYRQAIPRYVSIDDQGREDEFLNDYFPSIRELAAAVFLKGYQWPFSADKTRNGGSSIIDIAVYIERYIRGNRVYLDFTRNPQEGNFDLSAIAGEARDYLAASGALGAVPLERLERLNPPALELYRSRGIDLKTEYLEIDVLPQHHNGGAELSIWWETSVKHLFAAGECAGSHGIRRPGGSALNAGQVGGLRAASYIAGFYLKNDPWFGPEENAGDKALRAAADELAAFERGLRLTYPAGGEREGKTPIAEKLRRLQEINSRAAGFLRNKGETERSLACIEAMEQDFPTGASFHDKALITVFDAKTNGIRSLFRPVRPIPADNLWFEKVWADYRDGAIFR